MRSNENTEFYYSRLKKFPKNKGWLTGLLFDMKKNEAFGLPSKDLYEYIANCQYTKNYERPATVVTELRTMGVINKNNKATGNTLLFINERISFREMMAVNLIMMPSNKNDIVAHKNTLTEILDDINTNSLVDIMDIKNLAKYENKSLTTMDMLQELIPFCFPNIIVRNSDNNLKLSAAGVILLDWLKTAFYPIWADKLSKLDSKKDLPDFYSSQFPKHVVPKLIYTNKARKQYGTLPYADELLREYLFTNKPLKNIEFDLTGDYRHNAYTSGILNSNNIDFSNNNRRLSQAFTFMQTLYLEINGFKTKIAVDESHQYINSKNGVSIPDAKDVEDEKNGLKDKNKKVSIDDQLKEDYRGIFTSNINEWYFKMKEVIQDYTSVSGRPFKYAERAHIYPVQLASKKDSTFGYIQDPKNGILLEPNIHKLFDNKDIILTLNGEFVNYEDHSSVLFKLRQEEIERIDIKYIELYQKEYVGLKTCI